jgi:hypothetical protein
VRVLKRMVIAKSLILRMLVNDSCARLTCEPMQLLGSPAAAE